MPQGSACGHARFVLVNYCFKLMTVKEKADFLENKDVVLFVYLCMKNTYTELWLSLKSFNAC